MELVEGGVMGSVEDHRASSRGLNYVGKHAAIGNQIGRGPSIRSEARGM